MLKRVFDLTLSLTGLLIFFPLAVLISILIKTEDGGPVMYTQERWGKGGKRFMAYKFRSMRPLRPGEIDSACKSKDRITRTGRLLRATAMDELPQLINIFNGDMSFVGPRALSVQEIGPETKDFDLRHQVTPGLTGLAQVCAAKNASIENKFAYDIIYAKKKGFWLDLMLISVSVGLTLSGSWECPRRFALNLTNKI